MRIAYFDCFSGISGDMVLGALVDAGLKLKELKNELSKLNLGGYEIKATKVKKHNLSGTKVNIITSHQRKLRQLKDIVVLIEKSKLTPEVKEKSIKIFRRLAEAEARVHNVNAEEVHFHELGALDSILDIVGSIIGIKKMEIEKVYSSPLNVGNGMVKMSHGVYPVPAPATAEILKGIPIYSSELEAELVTPTGATIITSISQVFGGLPQMKVEKIGYGAGERDLSFQPNFLRVFIGEIADVYEEDKVVTIETNIDDLNPQVYEFLFDRLLEKGALDVYLTPIIMKKSRPATKLSVLADVSKVSELISIIFKETSTLGVRIWEAKRLKATREEIEVKTKYGIIRVKVGRIGERVQNVAPEYEDCKKAALEYKVPFKEVYQEALNCVTLDKNFKLSYTLSKKKR